MGNGAEVLVAGAGPVGLTLAHELVRHGIGVRIVDAADGPASTSRAIATHPRTLETYDQLGLVDEMLAVGTHVDGFTMFNNGRQLVRLDADYRRNPTAYPFTLSIEQTSTEHVLREALQRRGVAIEWGQRLTDFRQDDTGVRTVLTDAQGTTTTATVPWLVGCDGGHSTVRKQLGLPLIGDSNDTWLLADATVTVDLPRNSIYWVRVGQGTLMLVPLAGENRWRLLDTVEVSTDGGPDAVARRFAAKFTAGLGRPVQVGRPTWISVFTAQQRMVPSLRKGRCLVAGDAAHVHSPASGQGLNTGVQEAFNLAWKLSMVVRGQAGVALLDSYEAERVPIGRTLLASTRQATTLVALRNVLAGVALPLFFGVVRNVPPLRTKIQNGILGQMSGLMVNYADSPLTSAESTGDLRPGSRLTAGAPLGEPTPAWAAVRAELRDVRWTLLVFASPGGESDPAAAFASRADGCRDWLSVRTVGDGAGGVNPLADPGNGLRADLGAAPGSWILVRPDGYLAARGAEPQWAVLRAALDRAHILEPDGPTTSRREPSVASTRER